jgi:hypothetical protein
MGKGKGHQSGSFGRKSQGAAFRHEFQEQVSQVHLNRPKPVTTKSTLTKERPRLASLGQLKGLIQERQSYEQFEMMQERRRNGFVPHAKLPQLQSDPIETHPPGWMLYYGEPDPIDPTVELLQKSCRKMLAKHLQDYLEAMGPQDFHGALSLLPSGTLSALSVEISKSGGITNELALVLGCHSHVERLSFHAALHIDETLTDEGIEALVPYMPEQDTHDSWEEMETSIDLLQLQGVSVRLKRLELIHCHLLTFGALERLFTKCSCITHLSLAGSLSADDGPQVLLHLSQWLPGLQVLDLSQCSWVTAELLHVFSNGYEIRGPRVYSKGCAMTTTGSRGEW